MVTFDPQKIVQMLREMPAAGCYRVGFSGGLDSTVLLQALAEQREQLPGNLQAIHVNHGLQSVAGAWQAHCETVCRKLNVDLVSRSIEVPQEQGESLEAAARERRYAVFAELMQTGDYLLLAHHLDDQLETFLLQALRGTGLAGLAAMPVVGNFADGKVVRPLLDTPRDALLEWACERRLSWVDDPSNQEPKFDRNFLRNEVLPRLKTRWPTAAQTVARTARHCAEALDLLKAQAEDDLRRYTTPAERSLPLQAIRELSHPRAKQLIRYWLDLQGFSPPPAHKLQQVFTEVLTAGPDRSPCVAWTGVELRRYRDRLYAQSPLPALPESFRIHPGQFHDLGSGLGRLGLVPGNAGIRADACPEAGLEVVFRSGGELCRPEGRAHRRPLKKWLQELDVLPWMRSYLPIIGSDNDVMAVAGLFTCAPYQAREGEKALRVVWENAPVFLGDQEKSC